MEIFLRGITVYHWNQFSSLKWFYLESLTFFTQFCFFFSISSYCELNIANHEQNFKWLGLSLHEKCPNPEFFLARIFRLNTGKCGPEKTPYLDTFHAVTHISETFHYFILHNQISDFSYYFCAFCYGWRVQFYD